MSVILTSFVCFTSQGDRGQTGKDGNRGHKGRRVCLSFTSSNVFCRKITKQHNSLFVKSKKGTNMSSCWKEEWRNLVEQNYENKAGDKRF